MAETTVHSALLPDPDGRKQLRREKIRARDALTPEKREALSRLLVANLIAVPEFQAAKTVLIYRAARGEVRLDALETAPEAAGKRLAFPLCVSDTEMIALLPHEEDAWVSGRYGITEPVPEKSDLILPEDIDLVVCPCTVFDENCNRMGMGAGFYDRYLERCVNAKVLSVAFECQKAERVPTAPWDKPMGMTVTERAVYRAKDT
jgi:5-formyltetrahydrofolate cyclo-ligase